MNTTYIIEPHLSHSAKGTEWKKHKYIKKVDGTYYYPDGYKGGRHLSSNTKNMRESSSYIRTGSPSYQPNSALKTGLSGGLISSIAIQKPTFLYSGINRPVTYDYTDPIKLEKTQRYVESIIDVKNKVDKMIEESKAPEDKKSIGEKIASSIDSSIGKVERLVDAYKSIKINDLVNDKTNDFIDSLKFWKK